MARVSTPSRRRCTNCASRCVGCARCCGRDGRCSGAFVDPQRAFLKRAAAAAGEARERAHQTLSAADLKHALRDMLHEVNRALNTSPRPTPLKRLARERARVARHSLGKRMRRARRAKGGNYAALHEVRRGAKHLRYLLEFFGPVLPRRESRRVKPLKRLQDRFGKPNYAVASERLVAQHREIFADASNADAALATLRRERNQRRRKAAKLLG
ncbi:CHAD domain-containing protein [Paraburkholderia heleia]|uniref:CHAD domain-containing protein n=1 Tax=Paraburkholderia heleia TaxID=634127 RepID=UPI001FDF5A07|nr:CHAD domain-containing protein [Paraburkholderia heleia]